ncbi:MAG: amidase, partial [Steroidobacteraceae bacterium]
ASDALHRQELEIINMIYCHVMSSSELLGYLP